MYQQIREHFRVKRGIIGAGVQTLTPVLARGLRLGREYGVVVSDIFPRSLAAAAGLQVLDIILMMDGRPMENGRQFEVNLYGKEIGSQVQLDILRASDTIRRNVTVVERPDAAAQFLDLTSPEQNLIEPLGLLCLTVDERIAAMIGALRIPSGVLVAAKEQQAGPGLDFEPGDIIHAVNRTAVTTLEEFKAELAKYQVLEPVVVQIERRGQLRFIYFEIE